MGFSVRITSALLLVLCHLATGQLPQRLQIPGALILQGPGPRPGPFRQQRINEAGPPPRLRRPPPSPAPIRPVVEEPEEPQDSNSFDDEVAKLGLSVLQSAVRQAVTAEDEEEEEVQRPVQFRPERPIPVLRQDVREGPGPFQRPPQTRGEQREPSRRPIPAPETRDDFPPPRQQQQIRQSRPQIPAQPPPQPIRQQARIPRPPPQSLDDDEYRSGRKRKPVVQILRKYRTDNEDGSITWGYENEDGTFKEETLGVDCVTRGRYGYVDPDGVTREYSYETGNKCDKPEEEEEEEPLGRPNLPQPKKPQFRPQPAQYQKSVISQLP